MGAKREKQSSCILSCFNGSLIAGKTVDQLEVQRPKLRSSCWVRFLASKKTVPVVTDDFQIGTADNDGDVNGGKKKNGPTSNFFFKNIYKVSFFVKGFFVAVNLRLIERFSCKTGEVRCSDPKAATSCSQLQKYLHKVMRVTSESHGPCEQ